MNINKYPLLKKISISLIPLFLIILLIKYILQNIESFSSISFKNPEGIFLLIILYLINFFLTSRIMVLLLRPHHVNLDLHEGYALSVASSFYNIFVPFRGGIGIRALYLKKKYDLAYSNFIVTIAGTYIIMFLFGSLLGLISTISIKIQKGIFSWFLFLIFSGIFFIFIILITLQPKLTTSKNIIIKFFSQMLNGWNETRKYKKNLLTLSIIVISQLFMVSIIFFTQFYVFGIPISFFSATFLAAVNSLSVLIQIVPAGLGVNEALFIFSANTIGITPVDAIPASILGRLISISLLFILGLIYTYKLLRNINKKQ